MNLRSATLQRLLVLAVIALALAYVTLLQPLVRRVAEEEKPLLDLQNQVAQATVDAGLPRGSGFLAVSNRLASLAAASHDFAAAVGESLPRLDLPPEVRARLEEPFQLVEFLNESQRRLEELAAQAQARKVALTPGLPRGFPAYKPELARPELLWVQLATVNRVVLTAIRAGVRDVTEISVDPLPFAEPTEFGPAQPPGTPGPSPSPPPSDTTPASGPRWTLLRLHLTASGGIDALARLLLALALTPEELKRTGLAEELGGRPALFLDHVLLRRNQLDDAELGQLEVVVSTVVLNDDP